MYKYGIIGNCHSSAYISDTGSIDWLCFPRPDSEPIFGKLLDPEGGQFSFELEAFHECNQHYIPNTNILVTQLLDREGNGLTITDFCPRFEQHGRMFRPASVFRIVEPKGRPSLRVVCNPISGWEKVASHPVRGNSHLRFEIRGDSLRLVTNMPLTYLCEGTKFQLSEKLYFGLSWSFGIEEDLPGVAESFLRQTKEYWKNWVKHCSIPTLFQKETIRSALTLKLHCFEDTGAILAALSTSLPETIGGVRNWDYRFCWLRDAYFSLSAFQNLGHFEEMEGFLKFLLDLASQFKEEDNRLAPVYSLSKELPLPESILTNWAGFQGSAPVRNFNQAAEHIQNDVYGEMILSFTPIFMDERFSHLRSPELEKLMLWLGQKCSKSIGQADAGLWEIRNGWRAHSFSDLLSWAGLDRLEKIREMGRFANAPSFAKERDKAHASLLKATADQKLWNAVDDRTLDSSLSLLAIMRFPEQEIVRNTVFSISEELHVPNHPSHFYRYLREDDFGKPESSFMICSFWMAQAFAKLGEKEKALSILENVKSSANHLGLFSEHFCPGRKQQLGNFPQAYSHVGMINAAFAVSPPWTDVI